MLESLPSWLSVSYFETSARSIMNQMDQTEVKKKLRQCFNAYISNRKLLAATVLAILLLLYFWPSRLSFHNSLVAPDASRRCLDEELRQYQRLLDEYDATLLHTVPAVLPSAEKRVEPFVGNGHIGIGFSDAKQQTARVAADGNLLKIVTDFRPIIFTQIEKRNSVSAEAYITEYKKGVVRRFQSFLQNGECVVIVMSAYVHRVYPSLLVQDISVKNRLDNSVEVEFFRPENNWEKATKRWGNKDVNVISKTFPLPGSSNVVSVSAVLPPITARAAVRPRSSETFRFHTFIDSDPKAIQSADSTAISEQRAAVEERMRKDYEVISKLGTANLDMQHEQVWEKLWSRGFGVSNSLAPNQLNGDMINATRYAVLSNTRAPLHESNVDQPERDRLRAQMANNQLCFNAHRSQNTLTVPSKLWSSLASVDDMVSVTYSWRLTLEKRGGCVHLLAAGADGMAEAMVLSFGGLKFSPHHLEFDAVPSELHRDYRFTGIEMADGGGGVASVWVEIAEDNRPLLFVAVDGVISGHSYFACDAGCLDDPVQLSSRKTKLPVKQTNPLTPILYITSDRKHLEDLHHAIHVQEVVDAPAHEHHVMAMHRHGHRLGGLPTLFWVLLALLIVTFHLFLFKLIYNEWTRDYKNYYPRGRYSM